jgi:hypothetical protein
MKKLNAVVFGINKKIHAVANETKLPMVLLHKLRTQKSTITEIFPFGYKLLKVP